MPESVKKGEISLNKLTFCPFINGECRADCVFRAPYNIALNGRNTSQCELAAFACCSDEATVQTVSEAIKALRN